MTTVAPPFRRAAGGAGARIEIAMWVLFAVAAVYAVVDLVDLVYLVRVRGQLPTPDFAVLSAGESLGITEMWLYWAFVIVYAVFVVLSRRAVQDLGVDPGPILYSPLVLGWRVAVGITLVAAFVLPRADLMNPVDFGERLRWMVPVAAARLALAVLLVVPVLGLRRRAYAAMLATGVAALPGPGERRMTLLDMAQRAAAIAPPLPVAGDAWWSEVADRVAAAGTALPLLESGGPRYTVEPGADLAALRATLAPGATVTLLPSADASPDDPEAMSAVVPG